MSDYVKSLGVYNESTGELECHEVPMSAGEIAQKRADDTEWAAGEADRKRAAIKTECARRILARYPEWKQGNMLRAGDDRAAAGFAWIDATRAASNALELASPIPDDIADDRHWPA